MGLKTFLKEEKNRSSPLSLNACCTSFTNVWCCSRIMMLPFKAFADQSVFFFVCDASFKFGSEILRLFSENKATFLKARCGWSSKGSDGKPCHFLLLPLMCHLFINSGPHCDSASSKLAGFSFSFTHRPSRPPFNIVHREAVHCCLQLTSEIGVSNQKENFRLTWVSQTVYARPVSLKLSNLLLFSTAEQFFCLQIWLLDYCVVCFALVECCH